MQKNYFFFALPLIFSALLSQSYGFINSMMIGEYLGSTAFAATAVTTLFLTFVNTFLTGYHQGSSIYFSVLFGKNENGKMLNAIKSNFIITTAFAFLIPLICNLFAPQIFKILNVNNEVYKNAMLYFRIYVFAYPTLQFVWGFPGVARAMGETKMPLVASAISGIFNVFFNFLFLKVMHKGIHYCAISTIFSTSIITVFYILTFMRLFKREGIISKGVKFRKDEIKALFNYGTPTMLQQMAMSGCSAIISPLINSCPTAAISGYSISGTATTLISTTYQNSTLANTTLVAQAMGAKRIDKIKEGMKIGFTQSLLFFGVVMAAFVIFAPQFAGLFLDPSEAPESFKVCVNIIRYLLPLLLFNVFNNIYHGIFRAVGSGKLMVFSTVFYAIAVVTYAYVLFGILPTEFKIYGAPLALGAAYITEAILGTILFLTGVWKSKEYREIEKAGLQNT